MVAFLPTSLFIPWGTNSTSSNVVRYAACSKEDHHSQKQNANPILPAKNAHASNKNIYLPLAAVIKLRPPTRDVTHNRGVTNVV